MTAAIRADNTAEESSARRVQLPVELSPAMHRRLTGWCRDTARILDVRGLARADVFEAMFEHLIDNPAASAAVRARLKSQL